MKKYPVSKAQMRILSTEMMNPKTIMYTENIIQKLKGVSGELAYKVLIKVVEAHKDINIRFSLDEDGQPYQYIGEPAFDKVKLIDFNKDMENRKAWIKEAVKRPIDCIFDGALFEFYVLITEEDTWIYHKFNHTIVDGTSHAMLMEEILSLIEAVKEGKEDQFKFNEIDCFGYLDCEKEYGTSPKYVEDKNYWMNNITDTEIFPEPLNKNNSIKSKEYIFDLPENLQKKINKYLMDIEGKVSIYKFTMAVFATYFARRNESESICLLTVYENRGKLPEKVANTVSMIVSSFPVIMDFDSQEKFLQVLKKTGAILRNGINHADYPFNDLTNDLKKNGLETDRLLNYSVVSNSYPEGNFDSTYLPTDASPFPFIARVNPMMIKPNSLKRLIIEYLTDVFSEKDIEYMAQGIMAMIEDIVDNPEKQISELEIMGNYEKRLLLEDYRGVNLEYDKSKTFIDNFREIANKQPNRVATVDLEGSMTYSEIDKLSDSIAARLQKQFNVKGRFVAVMMKRCKGYMAAVIGIQKAGAAYIPVDSSYPKNRISYMLDDSDAAVLITNKEFLEMAEGYKGEVMLAEEFIITGEKPQGRPHTEDLAYMIYTSGSTGNPKGVMIKHKSLAAFIAWRGNDYENTNQTRTCLHSSFSFDASIFDLFPVLNYGGALYFISEEMRFDMANFYKFLVENKIDDCTLSTQFGMEMLKEYNIPLKFITLGGEKLKKLPKRNLKLINGYGPTEFTVCSSYFIVDQDKEYENIPIGKPVANSWNYIVDKNMKLLPRGCAGELCLSGVQLSAGYRNLEEKTAAVFLDNPYSTCEDNKKLYKTGDLVRWNENGELEYLGRIDDQVKLRGFRIELGEIESAMVSFPDINFALAKVQGDVLVAYYVSEKGIDENSLLEALSIKLPEYMVPSAVMRMEAFPKTPGGKIDKRSFPKIEFKADEIVLPETNIQRKIFEVVSEIIGTNNFGIKTDLFSAGMSSLAAIKLAAKLAGNFDISIGAKDIMKAKTIVAIEAIIMQAGKSEETTDFEVLSSYPVSQSQMGVYYDFAKNPSTLKYNIPCMIEFSNKIDEKKLGEATRKVIDTHPYVKTHFTMEGQELRQINNDKIKVEIPVSFVKHNEIIGIKEKFVRSFNLFEGPLFRIEVYGTEKNTYLFTDFHHLIFDGSSMDIFLKELQRAYEEEDLLGEKHTSFYLAVEEQKLEGSEQLKQADEYFAARLSDCDGATVLPGDLPASKEEGNLKEAIFEVNREKVENYCKENGVTPSNLFLSAVSYVIGRFAYTRKVLISTISSGRGDARYQNNIGMMVKTLPLVIDIEPKTSTINFVKYNQNSMFATMEHDCCAFTRIADKYQFSPQIMYAYQSGVVNGVTLCGQNGILNSLELKTPKFKLSIHIESNKEDFKVIAQYNDANYSENLMETFVECVSLAVNNIIDMPNEEIGKISILSENQLQKIYKFNCTQEEGGEPILHRMFEKQVKLKPEHVALIASDGKFTFKELNNKANVIANYLIDKGIDIEDRVALILPRDSNLIAAMLGVIKAGGAYIPVDTEYPIHRINHVLSDSRAKYVITTKNRIMNLGNDEKQDKNQRAKTEILYIDDIISCFNPKTENPETEVKPENLCYIIYTSGSTGLPKGVMLEHRGISNYVIGTEKNCHVKALVDDVNAMMSITTVSFDMFLKESFTSLMNGVTLVFAGEEETNNPNKLAELFEKTGADAFNATPSRMLQYLELPAFEKVLSKCKVIMAGGEKYPDSLFIKLKQISTARLFNTYGPTEITVSCNAKELISADVSVGAPLRNVWESVCDSDGNLLPVGVVGELLVGGTGVARGYFGNSAMTGEKFINYQGKRVYKTGDLAKWTENGDVVILGRTDNQIKLRGLRIELGEIENAIAKYEGIKRVVVVIKKIQGNEHLCAYYTADREIKVDKLRESLLESLTKYMVPTAYMQLGGIPETPNGKADIKALPNPILMALNEFVAPRNKAEEEFCNIFSKVLGIEKVGIKDDFFEMGGTSLLVTKVTIEAMNMGYQSISYGDVFVESTPELLAAKATGKEDEVTNYDDIDKYDYTKIDKILSKNTLDNMIKGELRHIGNILLTGATGFLGIHILKEYLDNYTGVAYCILRKGRQKSLEARLKNMLVYYFDDSFDEMFNSRIVLIEGNLTSKDAFDKVSGYPIDTIVNCAANVKHFAKGSEIEDINVGGVANVVEFAKTKGARVIQISTTSIAGYSIDDRVPTGSHIDEKSIYLGQITDNKYVNSKFRAERIVLDAVAKDGLDGKIMRVGNLMARNKDGEFQANFASNSFVNRLRAYQRIGKIGYSAMNALTEFAPIDCTAKAILLLAQTPKECVVFHPYNNHEIYIGDVIYAMNERGIKVEPVEACEFEKAFEDALANKDNVQALAGLVAYLNMGKGKPVMMVPAVNNYTVEVLYRLGFKWPITTDMYLDNFLKMLEGLGFFDKGR